MHGSYRAIRAADGLRYYSTGTDVETLVASFPALSFIDPNPRTPMQKVAFASLATTASLLLFTLGGSAEKERAFVKAIPAPAESTIKGDRFRGQIREPTASSISRVIAPSVPDTKIEISANSRTEMPVEPQIVPERTADASAPPETIDAVKPQEDLEFLEIAGSGSAKKTASESAASSSTEITEPLLAAPTSSSPNEGGVTHLSVREAGLIVGQFEFRDDGQKIRVKLESVLAVFADRFDPAEYERLANSPAAQDFVEIERLSSAGLGMRYDPVYDEIVMENTIDAQARGAGVQSQEPSEYS